MDFIQKLDQKYNTEKHISVNLLNKEYIISCPPDTEFALKNAVQLVEKKMKEAQRLGHDYSNEQAAIIAALNLAYDLNLAQQPPASSSQIQETLDMLNANPDFVSSSNLYALNDEGHDYFESDPELDTEENELLEALGEDDEEEELDELEEEDDDDDDEEDYDDYLDEDDPDFEQNEEE